MDGLVNDFRFPAKRRESRTEPGRLPGLLQGHRDAAEAL